MNKKMLKLFGKTLLLIWGGVIIASFLIIFVIAKMHNAGRSFQYSPGIFETPSDRFKITCRWNDMIEGQCDKKDSYELLTKKEIDWIIEQEKVSKEDLIIFCNKRIADLKDREEKEVATQDEYKTIKRLENVIEILKQ